MITDHSISRSRDCLVYRSCLLTSFLPSVTNSCILASTVCYSPVRKEHRLCVRGRMTRQQLLYLKSNISFTNIILILSIVMTSYICLYSFVFVQLVQYFCKVSTFTVTMVIYNNEIIYYMFLFYL